MERVQILAVAASVVILIGVVELVRSGKMRERYSLVWLLAAAVLLVLSASKNLMAEVSAMMGIYYPPTSFFLLAFVFLTLIAVQFSVFISSLAERNKVLAQEIAILKARVKTLEGAGADEAGELGAG